MQRTADLALFSLPHVFFQQEDEEEDNSERLFFSSRDLMLRRRERESPVKEDCVFVSGWMLMTGLCNESLKS